MDDLTTRPPPSPLPLGTSWRHHCHGPMKVISGFDTPILGPIYAKEKANVNDRKLMFGDMQLQEVVLQSFVIVFIVLFFRLCSHA